MQSPLGKILPHDMLLVTLDWTAFVHAVTASTVGWGGRLKSYFWRLKATQGQPFDRPNKDALV